MPNAKLEKDILRWVLEEAIKSKGESDLRLMGKIMNQLTQ
ncbi:hypothetical protein CLFE_046970 (plasmid) [Clostridium felsineum DSM 794]|nr:hypothetical protein CLFE_046970 [Clostridium felsineum DSM 794]